MASLVDSAATSHVRTATLPSQSAAFTVMAWVKLIVDRATATSLFWFGSATSGSTGRGLRLNTALQLTIWNGSASNVDASTLTVGVWSHLTWVNTGSSIINLYMDGVLIASSGTAGSASFARLQLGCDGGGTFFINGAIAGFKMWTAALSVAEINRELDYYVPMKVASLDAWVPFLGGKVGSEPFAQGTDFSGRGLGFPQSSSVVDGPPIMWAPSADSRKSWSTNPIPQTKYISGITPIASTMVFNAPSVLTLGEVPHIASTMVFYTPSLSIRVELPTITSTMVFNTPSVIALGAVPHVASTMVFNAPTVFPILSFPTIASTFTLNAPVVQLLEVFELGFPTIESTFELNAPTVALPEVPELSFPTIASTFTINVPEVIPAALLDIPTITSTMVFNTPSVVLTTSATIPLLESTMVFNVPSVFRVTIPNVNIFVGPQRREYESKVRDGALIPEERVTSLVVKRLKFD